MVEKSFRSQSSQNKVTVADVLKKLEGKTGSIAQQQPDVSTIHADLVGASAPGFLYSQQITGSSCSSIPKFVSGTITNTCINYSDNTSYFGFCSNGKATAYYYNATNCQAANLYNADTDIFLGCYRNHLGGTNEVQIESAGCSTSVSPLPLTSAYYGVMNYYDINVSNCNGQAYKFDAYLNNKCIPDQSSGDSSLYNFPTRTYYSSSTDCTGPAVITANYYPTTCTSNIIGQLVQGMNPTPRPTTSYISGSASDGDDDNTITLGQVAGITVGVTAFVAVIFFLGFLFASRAGKRSSSRDGNEMTSNPMK